MNASLTPTLFNETINADARPAGRDQRGKKTGSVRERAELGKTFGIVHCWQTD